MEGLRFAVEQASQKDTTVETSLPFHATMQSSVQVPTFDVVVIGGGVVGLSILRHATIQGYKVALVERNDHLAQQASGHNSGIICTGVDAPLESLERSLIRESISHIRTYCQTMNVPMRECGSLICAWPKGAAEQPSSQADAAEDEHAQQEDTDNQLDRIWRDSCDAGDTDARVINATDLQTLEPHLNPACLGAVHVPGEIVVDPWLYSISLATHALENGATIYTNFAVDLQRSAWDEPTRTWTLLAQTLQGHPVEDQQPPNVVRARAIVNAAGVWSDLVEQHLLKVKPTYEARPRRGQYVVLEPSCDGIPQQQSQLPKCLLRHPIQPIPTHRTKGVFVFSSIYNQLVVGPTALDQESRVGDKPCPKVRDELIQFGSSIVTLPNHCTLRQVGEYVGIRPGIQRRDYNIQLKADKNWVTCSGIRSTGLTASLGIGRHVVYLLQQGVLPTTTKPILPNHRTTPLPSLDDMIQEFHSRDDGFVTTHGRLFYVTHPLTTMGWKSMPADL